MLKKTILAIGAACAMVACSSKGDFTCECKPDVSTFTPAGGTASPASYNDRESYVMTQVNKDFAQANCLSYEETITNSNNGTVNSTSTRKKSCTLTEK